MSAEKMTMEQIQAMKAEIERLKKDNSEMKKRSLGLDLNVSDRGQLEIKFGTYACRLYKNQWSKILDHQEEVKKFITDNNGDLA
jgi:hypothetical protein